MGLYESTKVNRRDKLVARELADVSEGQRESPQLSQAGTECIFPPHPFYLFDSFSLLFILIFIEELCKS